jgi:hypothetical protein
VTGEDGLASLEIAIACLEKRKSEAAAASVRHKAPRAVVA